jgi:hypothetical protein
MMDIETQHAANPVTCEPRVIPMPPDPPAAAQAHPTMYRRTPASRGPVTLALTSAVEDLSVLINGRLSQALFGLICRSTAAVSEWETGRSRPAKHMPGLK